MSRIRERRLLPMGKGCSMRFLIDDSVPRDSINHHWSEVTYDGKPGSWVPVIGSHWHKHHDEYMVFEGQIDFTLDGKPVTLKQGDAPLHIPKLKVHSFKFVEGVKTIFTEKTYPAGDFKEKSFGELLETADGRPNSMSVMRTFYDGDTFIALPGGFKGLGENITWVMGRIAKKMTLGRRQVLNYGFFNKFI